MSRYPISHVAALAFFLTMSLQACTHTMVVSSTAPQQDYAKINRSFADRDAKVRFGIGAGRIFGSGVFDVRDLRFEPDSVRFTSPLEGRVAIPAETFMYSESRSRMRGAQEGALIGILIGGLGLVINQALPIRNSSSELFDVTQGDCNSSCVGRVFLGGALYGGIIGLIRQSRVKVVRR